MHNNVRTAVIDGTAKVIKTVKNTAARAAVASTGLVAAGSAFAGGGSDFDGSTVTAKIVTYTAVGVAILAAMALGRWTLRALGIIGGK